MRSLRIATRGSALAMWQARWVAAQLSHNHPDLTIELIEIKTTGDQQTQSSLSQIGGQGVFTKEIQVALLNDRADIAVHSLKDLPTVPIAGLQLAAIPERGPVGEAFISYQHDRFDQLPKGATVATGSPRRRALLLHRRPDLNLIDIRGNIDSRLQKLAQHRWDGMILAEAGLARLGWSSSIKEILDPAWMVPAVGQGALALECRSDDQATADLLQSLHHKPTGIAVSAERAFLAGLAGGCMLPTGALATVTGQQVTLHAVFVDAQGRFRLDEQETALGLDAERLGQRLAQRIQARLADMPSG